ncbi:hypothetical protein [Wielerella bovis]|nr:hypothetical protein [Wielerella bovis]MCG7656295.1 hypothetical protein [Wielerella bovis]ULJ69628.1 hypothetical protein MIS45_01830 [Wielerella bovis]
MSKVANFDVLNHLLSHSDALDSEDDVEDVLNIFQAAFQTRQFAGRA